MSIFKAIAKALEFSLLEEPRMEPVGKLDKYPSYLKKKYGENKKGSVTRANFEKR